MQPVWKSDQARGTYGDCVCDFRRYCSHGLKLVFAKVCKPGLRAVSKCLQERGHGTPGRVLSFLGSRAALVCKPYRMQLCFCSGLSGVRLRMAFNGNRDADLVGAAIQYQPVETTAFAAFR